jgi:hypothetical protein
MDERLVANEKVAGSMPAIRSRLAAQRLEPTRSPSSAGEHPLDWQEGEGSTPSVIIDRGRLAQRESACPTNRADLVRLQGWPSHTARSSEDRVARF